MEPNSTIYSDLTRRAVQSGLSQSDKSFGPAITGQRGNFDFTLLFEDSFLALAPSALLLVIIPFRALWLSSKSQKVRDSSSQTIKISLFASFVILQLALILLWALSPAWRTPLSVPAAAVEFAAALSLCALSSYEHSRTVRPSLLIDLYLLFTLAFDAVRIRTLFLMNTAGIRDTAAIYALATILKLGLLVTEAQSKRHLLLPHYQWLPPESTSGVYTRTFFWWLNPLFKFGYAHTINLKDVYALDPAMTSISMEPRFKRAWVGSRKGKQHALILASFVELFPEVIVAALPRFILIGFKFAEPFLIKRTVEYVQDAQKEQEGTGWGLIGAYFFVYLGQAILNATYNQLQNRALTMLRGGLTCLIYQKTLDLSTVALDQSAALTLMSGDIEKIVEGLKFFQDSWAPVIEVGIAVWLLYTQLGIACLAPAMFFIVQIIGLIAVSYLTPIFQTRWMTGLQSRVSFTSVLLGSMRSVKLLGLSKVAETMTQALRVHEILLSKRFRLVLAVRVLLQNSMPFMAPLLTFAWFTVRSNKSGVPISAPQAYTVLSILVIIELPINFLMLSFPMIFGAASNFQRIQDYLESDSREDHRLQLKASDVDNEVLRKGAVGIEMINLASSNNTKDRVVVALENCSFGWEAGKPPVVSDISFRLRSSNFIMIIGPVGCGKSTLVKGILGETPSSKGFVYCDSMQTSFADQEAWVQNATVQDTIVGQGNLENQWLSEVLSACALKEDIERWPQGLRTIVGSKGLTLSGGQKQRLALARAIYARQDLIILDDIFSGLDADTEELIFSRVFTKNGLLRRCNRTIVLVTHAVHRLPYADNIIALNADGTLAQQGTYEQLRDSSGYVQSLAARFREEKDAEAPALEEQKEIDIAFLGEAADPVEAESDKIGKTGTWATRAYYFQAGSYISAFFSLFWVFIYVFSSRSSSLIVNFWASDSAAHGVSVNNKYIYIWGALAVVSLIFLQLAIWQLFQDMGPRASRRLHQRVLTTTMAAPLSYFTKTDSGSILNRFSQDMALIDNDLPFNLVDLTFSVTASLVIVGLTAATARYFLVTLPFVIALVATLQKIYLHTSRQIRLLDIECKAPLYSHFAETIGGLVSVRAFNWQSAFHARNVRLLDDSQRPFYLLYCIQQWLTLVMDLVVTGLAVVLMLIIVSQRHSIDSGIVGVGLLNIMSLNGMLTQTIRCWTGLETALAAVERVRTYADDTEIEALPQERIAPVSEWPAHGAVAISQFAASYSADSALVLQDVSLNIKAGEKFGICGRSGSGKSSLLAALLHILEYRSGRITIDGQDISTVQRQVLCGRLNVIPQEPYFLKGTVRLNADPWSSASGASSDVQPNPQDRRPPASISTDEAMIAAFTKCRVWDVLAAKGGLDAQIDSPDFLSHGQRQLFCLARAILRKSKIVILDEVSASVDIDTDRVMQAVIREEFEGCTIIAVAHRLDTIVDFDRIAVLSKGSVVECGTPAELLGRNSAFRELYET